MKSQKRCPSILKTLGGSTKGLHTHLSTKHNIKVISASTSQDTENLNTAPPPAKRKWDGLFALNNNCVSHMVSIWLSVMYFKNIIICKDSPTSDDMDDNNDDDHLEDLDCSESVPTQALLRKQIKSIVKRLNSRDDTEEEERSESLTDVELRPETSQPQLTLKEKLQLEIDKSIKSPDP
ncbi:hypothetical protein EVAR_5171_1 [Eumeta japonica]|uniref:BED-type domain-containing protein n=1 Tax=Eumeta variegata TaxID=151549 RepID=A0A4C1V330_EUMVA|nr:hypothetical protein EVAR_5171_1 [Eumeta japonica]